MARSQLRIVFFLLLFTTPAYPWSVKNAANDAYNQVATLLERTKTGALSSEYEIKKNSIITLNNTQGNITIQSSWNRPALIVEAEIKGKEKDLSHTAFSINKDDTHVTIQTESPADHAPLTVDYSLIIPKESSVVLATESGNITINDIKGTITAQSNNGNIIIENGTNSIQARAAKGSITIEQVDLPATCSLFLEAYKEVKLTLSPRINANLTAKTARGKITSNFLITLDPVTTLLNKTAWKQMQQDIRGTIGSGGAPITVDVTKGNVILLEQ